MIAFHSPSIGVLTIGEIGEAILDHAAQNPCLQFCRSPQTPELIVISTEKHVIR